MYALITVDMLEALDENRVSELLSDGLPPDAATLNVWRALDDDRIPYYIVVADNEGIELFFEREMRNTGVTIIQEICIGANDKIAWKDALS